MELRILCHFTHGRYISRVEIVGANFGGTNFGPCSEVVI